MASFSESALEQKLSELNNSQQSIQTLSLWVIHHRKHCKTIVSVWYKELLKAKPSRKLTFMYLANDVIQNSKKKGPEYSKEFAIVLVKAFQYVLKNADDKTEQGLTRLLNVWKERGVYNATQLEDFRSGLKKRSLKDNEPITREPSAASKEKEGTLASMKKLKKRHYHHIHHHRHRESKVPPLTIPSPPSAAAEQEAVESAPETTAERSPGRVPPEPEAIIKAILDLENSASSDATVREKIASLPPEVSDISLLDRVRDKNTGTKLIEQVNDACALLVDYNGRLGTELEERREVAKMLGDFISTQKDLLTQNTQQLEEYQQKLQKVNQVRAELRSHIQNLPDLTLLPDVTGGLAPLPSAGDLFSLVQQ